MGTTKITLSSDQQTVKTAKRLAKKRGTSVSSMFFSFIREEAKSEKIGIDKVSPGALEARGLAKMPKGKTNRQLLEEVLAERHSGNNNLAKEEKIKAVELSPGVKAISGIAKMPKGKTYRQIIEEAIIEKYYGIDE